TGDEILITELEHHANVAPWQALVKERGVTLNVAQMDPESGQLDWNDFERLISPRTKVVAFGAGCNALGTVNDYGRAVERAHSVGALALIDAVHYAPYFLCDVKEMDCDFLTCSAYKFYGPPHYVERTPTVSFIIKGVASTDVARRLSERGLFVSHGDFYAQTVVDRLGLQPEGLVRVGCACYTSDDEVDRLIEAVRETVQRT